MIFIIALAWPIFLCTCCGNCCCFNKNVKPGILGLIYYIIAVTLNAGVIIAAIVGFARSSKFTSSFDGATCSIINFIEHMKNGEEKTEFPKWIGTNNIVSTLNSLSAPIDTIKSDYSSVFNGNEYNSVVSEYASYEGKIENNIYTNLYGGVTGLSGSTVYPLFTSKFENDTTEYSKLIIEEFNSVIKNGYDNIQGLKNAGATISDPNSGLDTTLGGYSQTFSDMEQTISNVGDPAIDNILKVRDKAFDLFLLAFKILYGVFLALAIALITLLSLYVWLKFTFLKIPTHIFWNVAMLICFLTLLIGSLLGIVTYIFNAISPVMTYLLSKEYLEDPSSLFSQTGDSAKYVDICLNGNGDLSTALGVGSGPAADLEKFDFYSKGIQAAAASTPDHCTSYEKIMEQFDAIEEDLSKATDSSYGNDDIQAVIDSLNTLTLSCSPSEYYTTSSCKAGYIPNATNGNKCLIFKVGTSVPNTSCSTSATTINQKIDYINSISSLFSTQKSTLATLSAECNTLVTNMKKVYEQTDAMTKAMSSATSGAVGSDSKLFSMFNCNYLPHDLIQFINQFHNKFVPACKDVGISAVVGSIFSYVAVYFLLRALYHFAPSDAKTETAPKPKVEATRIESEMMKIKA